jgi:SAM-dependent methyltransferase
MALDTDGEWNRIASEHPYFGVLSDPKYLDPSPAALIDFFQSGEREIANCLGHLRRVFGPFEPRSALDFGCGVGRLAIPLARLTGHAVGIDVADDMLRLARRHAKEFAVNLVLAKAIPADRTFDWVNSIIVLQHIPPARGYPIIRDLWRSVAPGGALTLQVTIFKDENHQHELLKSLRLTNSDGHRVISYSIEDGSEPGMSMFDYDLGRVFAVMDLHHGQPVYMEKTNHGGCHGFMIYIRK